MSDLSDLTVQMSMAIGDCDAVIYAYGWMPDPERDAVLDDAKDALRDAHEAWDAALVEVERGLGVDEYDPSNAVYTIPGVRLAKPIGSLRDEHERWERAREQYAGSIGASLSDMIDAIREWRIAGSRLIAALEGA